MARDDKKSALLSHTFDSVIGQGRDDTAVKPQGFWEALSAAGPSAALDLTVLTVLRQQRRSEGGSTKCCGRQTQEPVEVHKEKICLGALLESRLLNNRVQSLSLPGYAYAISQNKGLDLGEDRIVTAGSNDRYSVSLLMDGHGGQDVVRHVGNHLQAALLSECNASATTHPDVWRACVRSGFKKVQDDIHRLQLKGGTTAVAMFEDQSTTKVAFAWVGNSKAALVRGGQVHFRTSSHDLQNRMECDRIEQQRPKYQYRMRNSSLYNMEGSCVALTRALGDVEMQSAGLMSVPQVSEFMDVQAGDLLIMASGGLWDVIPPDSVAAMVTSLRGDGRPLREACASLADAAISEWTNRYGCPERADDVSIVIHEV